MEIEKNLPCLAESSISPTHVLLASPNKLLRIQKYNIRYSAKPFEEKLPTDNAPTNFGYLPIGTWNILHTFWTMESQYQMQDISSPEKVPSAPAAEQADSCGRIQGGVSYTSKYLTSSAIRCSDFGFH
jgi:hypothetical protein